MVLGFQDNKIFPFIINIFYSWKNLRVYPDRDFEPLPPCYRIIRSMWKDENSQELKMALEDACDYHVQESQSDTRSRYYQFNDLFFRVYPAEILSILQLRNHLNLEVPEIEHELLSLPTCKIKNLNLSYKNDLISKVKKRASFELGSFFDSQNNS